MAANDSMAKPSFDSEEISLPRTIRFWLLLAFDLLSIVCTFILLDYLLRDRKLRKALSNHVIILLLLLGSTAQLIEIPFYLAFIANSGVVKPSRPATCLAWWFVTFAMYNAGTIFMAWAATERHILVFRSQWISTGRNKILAHYLPMTILLLYILIYYIYVLFIFPCENAYQYALPICNAYPCYQANPFLGLWDFIVNNIVPTLLVALMSVAFLIRVRGQKRRLNQHNQWRKQRKMMIQLLSLSALNAAFNLPLNLVSLARFCGLPQDYGVEAQHYFYFLCYFLVFLFPFVCLVSYPELVLRLKRRFLCRKVQANTTPVLIAWLHNKNSESYWF